MTEPILPASVAPEDLPGKRREFKKLLAALTPKQKKFVLEYLKDFNATRSAKAAGYSATSAYSTGSENLRKPEIAAAVEAGLEVSMGANEVRARTAEVAAATMEDFLTIEHVPYTEDVVMDAEDAADLITDTIADLEEELDSCTDERGEWLAKELKRLRRLLRRCERAMDAGDDDSPSRSREVKVDVEWKTRAVTRIDLEKAKEAGKLHLIKKMKETKFGVEIELHDSSSARELLGKHYRLWGDRLSLENPDGSPIKFLIGVPEDAL